MAYQKYLAYKDAQKKMHDMIRKGTWKIKPATNIELITVFIARSSWYQDYRLLELVDKHHEVKDWLEGKPGKLDVELWGKSKTRYTFKDLKAYFERKGVDVKGKGKRKAAGSVGEGTGKKKKKKKVVEESSDSS